MSLSTVAISETYSRDGFVFPIDVVSEEEAMAVRDDLEYRVERSLGRLKGRPLFLRPMYV